MNLFINIFLTPSTMGHNYNRGLLPQDDKVDIFKWMLESLSIYENWHEICFYIRNSVG